jgi:hypothetical protein
VVTNCDFTENSAQYGGGLFAIDQCAPIFTNTLFRLQSATLYGGGVYCYTSYLTFNFCTLSQNDAYLGAAIDAHENSVANLANCTLSGNASGFGGVIRSFGASLDLTNTIIAFSAASSEAVYCVGSGGSVTLTCCNVYGNGGGDWVGCIETQLGERDNISSDPEFCSELPDTHMNWMLQSDSRCGPGQSVCGLIGAWGVGCGTSPVRHTSWGEIKTIYRP